MARFLREDAIARSNFCRSVTDCEDCAAPRRVARRVYAEEHNCGLDVVPPFCWVIAAARRVPRRVQSAEEAVAWTLSRNLSG